MTRSKLPLLAGMTTSLLVLRCGSDNGSPFTDAGGRAGSSAAGTTGQGATSGTGGSVAGSGGAAGASMECVPEASEACTGKGDCAGTKVCLADGSGFSPCECATGSGGEGGMPAAGGAGHAAGAGAGGAADGGVSGQGEGTGGVNLEAGSAGQAVSGGAGGDAGADTGTGGEVTGGMGGAAGVTSGGEGGAGDTGPMTLVVTDLMDTFIEECNRNVSNGSDDHVSVDTDPCQYQVLIGPAEPLAIPAGSVVEAATLRLECDNSGVAVEVYAVEEAWDEATLDWNTRPELGALQGSFTPDVGVIEIDLTNLVQAWVDEGTAFGVSFVQSTGTNGSDYWSTEAADVEQRPRLSITYSR